MILQGPTLEPANGNLPTSAIIFLHGVGADGENLIGLAPFMAQHFPDTIFISPNAPYSCDMAPPDYTGYVGYQWFSLLDRNPEKLLDGVTNVSGTVDEFIDEVMEQYNLTEDRIALVGFSQGTMTSLFVGPRRVKKLAGIVGFSGAILGGEILARDANTKPDICLIHGENDDVVPFAAMAQSEMFLKGAGFNVETHARPDLPHSIDPEGIEIASNFLRDRLQIDGQFGMKKINADTEDQENVNFEIDGEKQIAHSTWFRGDHCNFNPNYRNMESHKAVDKFILKGWKPESPIIDKDTKIMAFGSCFAENISKWLSTRKFNVVTKDPDADNDDVYVVRFGEGMVNSFSIRQQFEWGFEGKAPEEELWHGYDAQANGYDEEIRQKTLDLFNKTEVFIITLGLSEVWYDEKTGGVFWRAVPQDKYDPSRHKFRVSNVQENYENIKATYELIKKHRPDAKIIFTLSPIPLVATFRDVSCITANSVSKANLRAAIDQFMQEFKDEGFAYYWPSYEIIIDVFENKWRPDRRHPKKAILDYIMTLFEATWCIDSKPEMSLAEAWLKARIVTFGLHQSLFDAIENRDVAEIKKSYERFSSKKARATDLKTLKAIIEDFAQTEEAFKELLNEIEAK